MAKFRNGSQTSPIHSDEEHRKAIDVINALLDRDRLTPDEDDYLELLGLIVGAYEDSVYEHPEFPAVDRLRYLMEEHDLNQADLARETGIPVQSLSDILNAERRMSPKVGKNSRRSSVSRRTCLHDAMGFRSIGPLALALRQDSVRVRFIGSFLASGPVPRPSPARHLLPLRLSSGFRRVV